MITWNYISLAMFWLLGISINIPLGEPTPKFQEVPIMNVNVYLMGQDSINKDLILLIGQNIDYLNEEFEGQVVFNLNELFVESQSAFLPDIYKDYQVNQEVEIENIISPIEQKGGINIFLFRTYIEPGMDAALMGFTPRLITGHASYEYNSPAFDRIFMAYAGLESKTTLIHEMGHFFGLSHPWELCQSCKVDEGYLTNEDEETNHMSYGPNVEKFTTEQLQMMKEHSLLYRKYLMDSILKVYTEVSTPDNYTLASSDFR